MTDRTQVMSWLEGLAQDDWRQFHSDSEVQEIAKAAFAMLKEQEAVKPFHRCIGNEHTLIEDSHFDFCPYCGKPIDWEGR